MTTSPYQPTATGEIQLVGGSAAGGTLQDGIEGNYDFSISDVLKEAWQKTDGIKGTFLAAVFVFVLIVVGIELIFSLVDYAMKFAMISILEGMYSSLEEIPPSKIEIANLIVGIKNIIMSLLLWIVTAIVSLVIMVGIMMIGVYRSVDMPVRFSIVFDYFKYTIPLIIAAILMYMMMTIGLILLIIPGIYLMVAYGLTYLLIVDKNLDSWEAMEASRKAITHHWFKVFFTYFIMNFIITISSVLTLGIALIWTAPMMVNVTGILYRIMFGVEAARPEVVAR